MNLVFTVGRTYRITPEEAETAIAEIFKKFEVKEFTTKTWEDIITAINERSAASPDGTDL